MASREGKRNWQKRGKIRNGWSRLRPSAEKEKLNRDEKEEELKKKFAWSTRLGRKAKKKSVEKKEKQRGKKRRRDEKSKKKGGSGKSVKKRRERKRRERERSKSAGGRKEKGA